jgi:hypothetical protein
VNSLPPVPQGSVYKRRVPEEVRTIPTLAGKRGTAQSGLKGLGDALRGLDDQNHVAALVEL